MRYIVIDVVCIECNHEGSSEPRVILVTDDLEQAKLAAKPGQDASQSDAFVLDTSSGQIVFASNLEVAK